LQEINVVDTHSATIKDYRLSVVPSADGQHFQLSLLTKSGCGYSLFTNESFVIYEAKTWVVLIDDTDLNLDASIKKR